MFLIHSRATYLKTGNGNPTTGHSIAIAECIEVVRIFQAVLSPVCFGGRLLVGSAKNRQLGFCVCCTVRVKHESK